MNVKEQFAKFSEWKEKHARKRRGLMWIVTAVIALVTISIALVVGIVVFSRVTTATPALTGQANTTYTSITNGVYTSFNMTPVILTVVIAGIIISALLVYTGSRATGA